MKKKLSRLLSVVLALAVIVSSLVFQTGISTFAIDTDGKSLIDFAGAQALGSIGADKLISDDYYTVSDKDTTDNSAGVDGSYSYGMSVGSAAVGDYEVEKEEEIILGAYNGSLLNVSSTFNPGSNYSGAVLNENKDLITVPSNIGTLQGITVDSDEGFNETGNDTTLSDTKATFARFYVQDPVTGRGGAYVSGGAVMFYVEREADGKGTMNFSLTFRHSGRSFFLQAEKAYSLFDITNGVWTDKTTTTGTTENAGIVSLEEGFKGWIKIPNTSLVRSGQTIDQAIVEGSNYYNTVIDATTGEIAGVPTLDRFYIVPQNIGGTYGSLTVAGVTMVDSTENFFAMNLGTPYPVDLCDFTANEDLKVAKAKAQLATVAGTFTGAVVPTSAAKYSTTADLYQTATQVTVETAFGSLPAVTFTKTAGSTAWAGNLSTGYDKNNSTYRMRLKTDAANLKKDGSIMFYIDHPGAATELTFYIITRYSQENHNLHLLNSKPYYLYDFDSNSWSTYTTASTGNASLGFGKVTIPADFTGWLRIPVTSCGDIGSGSDAATPLSEDTVINSDIRISASNLGQDDENSVDYGSLTITNVNVDGDENSLLANGKTLSGDVVDSMTSTDVTNVIRNVLGNRNLEEEKETAPSYTVTEPSSKMSVNAFAGFSWDGGALTDIQTPIGALKGGTIISAVENEAANSSDMSTGDFFTTGSSKGVGMQSVGLTLPLDGSMMVYVKATGSNPVEMSIVARTANYRYALEPSGTYYLFDMTTNSWTEKAAVKSGTNSTFGAFEIPAGFEGYLRIPTTSFTYRYVSSTERGSVAVVNNLECTYFWYYFDYLGGDYGRVTVAPFAVAETTNLEYATVSGTKSMLTNAPVYFYSKDQYTVTLPSSNMSANAFAGFKWDGGALTDIQTPIGALKGGTIISAVENEAANSSDMSTGDFFTAGSSTGVGIQDFSFNLSVNGALMMYVKATGTKPVEMSTVFRGGGYRSSMSPGSTYYIYDMNTNRWETKSAVKSGTSSTFGAMQIPAGFEGYVRIPTTSLNFRYVESGGTRGTVTVDSDLTGQYIWYYFDYLGGDYGRVTVAPFAVAENDKRYIANNANLGNFILRAPSSYDVEITEADSVKAFATDANADSAANTTFTFENAAALKAGKAFMFYMSKAGKGQTNLGIDFGNSGLKLAENADVYLYNEETNTWSVEAIGENSNIAISGKFNGWVAVPYSSLIYYNGNAVESAVNLEEVSILPYKLNADDNLKIGTFLITDIIKLDGGAMVNNYDDTDGVTYAEEGSNVIFGANSEILATGFGYDSTKGAMTIGEVTDDNFLRVVSGYNKSEKFVPEKGRLYKLELNYTNLSSETKVEIVGVNAEGGIVLQQPLDVVYVNAVRDVVTYFAVNEEIADFYLTVTPHEKYAYSDTTTYINFIEVFDLGVNVTETNDNGSVNFIPTSSHSTAYKVYTRTDETHVRFTVDTDKITADTQLYLASIPAEDNFKIKDADVASYTDKVFNIGDFAGKGEMTFEYVISTTREGATNDIAVLKLVDTTATLSTDIISGFETNDIHYTDSEIKDYDVNFDGELDLRDLVNQKKKTSSSAYELDTVAAERLENNPRDKFMNVVTTPATVNKTLEALTGDVDDILNDNPDRGWRSAENNYLVPTAEEFAADPDSYTAAAVKNLVKTRFNTNRRGENVTVSRVYFIMSNYCSGDLSGDAIEYMNNVCQAYREMGVKMYLGIYYMQYNSSDYAVAQWQNVRISTIKSHVTNCYANIWNDYKDAIYAVNFALLGRYGEWTSLRDSCLDDGYYSETYNDFGESALGYTNIGDSSSTNYKNMVKKNIQDLVKTVLDAIPDELRITLRSPQHITEYDLTSTVSADLNRIGYAQDAFFGNIYANIDVDNGDDDMGQGYFYPNTSNSYWITAITRAPYSIMDGELFSANWFCGDKNTGDKGLKDFTAAATLPIMKQLRLTSFSMYHTYGDYNRYSGVEPTSEELVVEGWKNVAVTSNELSSLGMIVAPNWFKNSDGSAAESRSMYDYIGDHLGYRLSAENVTVTGDKAAGGTAKVSMDLKNYGMSAAFNLTSGFAILDGNNNVVTKITAGDPSTWYSVDVNNPSSTTVLSHKVEAEITLPTETGRYKLVFFLENSLGQKALLDNDITRVSDYNVLHSFYID